MITVCFTGRGYTPSSRPGFKRGAFQTREQWETKASKDMGWIVHAKVEAFTDYLVAPGGARETSKAKDARRWGVTVISYEQFWAMYMDRNNPKVSSADVKARTTDMSQLGNDGIPTGLEEREPAPPRQRPPGWGMF